MFDLWGQLTGQLFPTFMAVLIMATAAVSLRNQLFLSWFGWASVVIAVGLLTPLAYVVLVLVLVWVSIVSVWLYDKGA